MNKKYVLIGAVMIVCVLLIYGVFINNKKDVPDFVESFHNRDERYEAYFETYVSEGKYFKLNIMKNEFESESALKLYKLIQSDIEIIHRALGYREKKKAEIFVVLQTIEGDPYRIEEQIFCTPQDIENGAYRGALLQVEMDTNEPWVVNAAAKYIFHNEDYDVEALNQDIRDYFSDSVNMKTGILELYGAWFYPEYITEKEHEIVQKLAYSFAEYMIRNYGMESLMAGTNAVQEREWLSSIGVLTEGITLKDEDDLYKFSYSKKNQLVISNKTEEFYFTPEVGYADTPKEIKEVINNFYDGKRRMMELLQKISGSYYEYFDAISKEKTHIYFQDIFQNSYAYSEEKKTIINFPGSMMHEYVHILLSMAPEDSSKFWCNEGISEYISLQSGTNIYNKQTYMKSLQKSPQSNDLVIITRELQNLMKDCIPKSNNPSEFDIKLYYKLASIFAFWYPDSEIDHKLFNTIAEVVGSKQFSQYDGMELTYYQAEEFIRFLTEQYSFEKVLQYMLEEDEFEQVFGKTYIELKDRWISELDLESYKTESQDD